MKQLHQEFDIEIKYGPVIDFISSLIRINMNEKIKMKAKEYNVVLNMDILNWIENTEEMLSAIHKENMSYFFDVGIKVLGGGLFLLASHTGFDITIPEYIKHLETLDREELIYYLVYYNYQGDKKLNTALINKMLEKNDLFSTIDKDFIGSHQAKWKIYEIFKKTDIIKYRLIDFLKYYYQEIYKTEVGRINTFLKDYCDNNREVIIETSYFIINEYFSINNSLLANYDKLIVLISYFGEIQASYFGNNLIGFGFSFPQLTKKLMQKEQSLVDMIPILKALSDKTRIDILVELYNSPHYLTELAEKTSVSPPTIDYHIKKFYNAGLITLDKKDNRTYYKVNKDKLEKLINVLKAQFDI